MLTIAGHYIFSIAFTFDSLISPEDLTQRNTAVSDFNITMITLYKFKKQMIDFGFSFCRLEFL